MPVYALSSSRLALLAERAVERSSAFSPDALAALVFSSLWVEAIVNEMLHYVTVQQPGERIEELSRLRLVARAAALWDRDARLDAKLQVISAVLSGTLFDEGAQPFQDYRLLMRLRNYVVHTKPERLRDGEVLDEDGVPTTVHEQRHEHVAELVRRGVISEPEPGAFYPLMSVLEQPAVAEWAFNAARSMVQALIDMTPSSLLRHRLLVGFPRTERP